MTPLGASSAGALAAPRRAWPREVRRLWARLVEPDADAAGAALVERVASGVRAPAASTGTRLPDLLDLIDRARSRRRARLASAALEALADRWPVLSDPVRRAALSAGRSAWPALLEELSATRPAHAAGIAGDAGWPGLIPLLARLASVGRGGAGAGEDDASEVAERGLLRALARALGAESPEVLDDAAGRGEPSSVAGLDVASRAALADAARAYPEHRREGVLVAALVALDPGAAGSPLWEWAASDDPALLAFRGVLRRQPGALACRRAWRLLREASVRGAALERVARAGDRRERAALLSESYLALHPRRARALVSARPERSSAARQLPSRAGEPGDAPARTPGWRPSPEEACRLPASARRGLTRWLSAWPMRPRERWAVLEPLLVDPDALVRLLVARVAPARALPDFAFDAEPSVARHALLRWSEAGQAAPPAPEDGASAGLAAARARFLARAERSASESVRRVASGERRREGGDLSRTPESRLAWRRRLRTDPAGCLDALRERLRDPDRALEGVMLARWIGACPALSRELLDLASDGSERAEAPRVRATVAAALAHVPGPDADAALTRCLEGPDARVRANAVEALARRAQAEGGLSARPSLAGALIELKGDPQHRVRANALRALIQCGSSPAVGPVPRGEPKPGPDLAAQGASSLSAMLGDDRPMHRVAGLWLAERAMPGLWGTPAVGGTPADPGPQWMEVAARVAELARGDPDPDVRRRGGRCARRLLGEMREAWARRVSV